MKIALNAHLLSVRAGYRSAGIHGYIANILSHLASAAPNWQFSAFVGREQQMTFPDVRMRHARLDTEFPLHRIVWEQALQPFQLGGFDLYHALAFVAPLVLPLPSVVTVYDLSFLHYPQMLSTARRLYLRLLTGLSCRRAKRVMAISHSTAHDIITSLGISPEQVDVAACGYDRVAFRPLERAAVEAFRTDQGLPERFWLFVGTLEPRKNLVTLLNAYAALPRAERLPLVLGGGKGWLYDDIFAAIDRHGLRDDVRLPGYLSPEALPLWYNSAEVFLYPSVFEGFGLPVLEAMACGTPVVVADASSLPEVAGAAGLRVPARDVEAWALALRRAATDRDWREQASRQGLVEAERYDWRRTAEAIIQSYRRALDV